MTRMRIFGDSHQPACLDLTQMAAYFCQCAKATEPNARSSHLGILNAKAQWRKGAKKATEKAIQPEYGFTEYEQDEIRCDSRTKG